MPALRDLARRAFSSLLAATVLPACGARSDILDTGVGTGTDPTPQELPYLNVPKMASQGDRFVLADTTGRVAAGDRETIAWGALWSPDSFLIVPPSLILPLCDSAVVFADAAYRVSFTDAALLSEDEIGLYQPSGTVLADGALLVAGGTDPEFLPTNEARKFQ